jgi:hypothetical protein
MATGTDVFQDFDKWTDQFAAFVRNKGKVEPSKYRAFGYEPSGHLWKDLKLQWREKRIAMGFPPAGSSPAKQKELGINTDETLRPRKSEGERLRES